MEDTVEIDILDLLRKHVVLLIVATIVVAAASYGASLFLPDEYTASTTMYVLSRDEEGQGGSVTQTELSVADMITDDVTTIMKSSRVEREVAKQLGLDNLDNYKFDVENAANTRVVTLSVIGRNPRMAARVANATVSEVSDVATEIMHIQSVNVIDTAAVPTTPSGPNRPLIGAVGAAAGFLLVVGIIVVRDLIDTRVRSGEQAEEIVGVPVIAHFPHQ